MQYIIYMMLRLMEGESRLKRLVATNPVHQHPENILVLIEFVEPSVQKARRRRLPMVMVIAADMLLILHLTAATVDMEMAVAATGTPPTTAGIHRTVVETETDPP